MTNQFCVLNGEPALRVRGYFTARGADAAMRALWARFGKRLYVSNVALPFSARRVRLVIRLRVSTVSDKDWSDLENAAHFLAGYVAGTKR